VMVWTPAHFWALALLLREDYRAVGIPMLPVVKGPVVTARAIRRYGWATIALSSAGALVLPTGGIFYGLMLLPFNGRLLQMVRRLAGDPNSLTGAKGLFRWSILYLFGICLLLVLSRTDLASGFDHQVRVLLLQVQAI
jgi:protoheme IX farnesyltransferase